MLTETEATNMSQLKVLVTGANGQLGQQITQVNDSRYKIISKTKAELDITNSEACREQLKLHNPDVVIHCAAYTAVDKAESDEDSAFLVNKVGSLNIAKATEEIGAKLVYISTDYVFDGASNTPYEINDKTNPQTVYGRSKLAGELEIKAHHTRYFIVRTSWVFGEYGHNFVKTMLNMGLQQKPLTVVNDQVGSPTYTADLVQFIFNLIATEQYGIYHATNTGECSWYEFAKLIFERAGLAVQLTPCTTEQFPRPALRPSYSVLSQQQLINNGFTALRTWEEAVNDLVPKLLNKEGTIR